MFYDICFKVYTQTVPMRMSTYANICTQVHTYVRTYVHTCMHACMHTCIHTYIHTCVYIHIYIYVFAYFLMYTCVYIYILTCSDIHHVDLKHREWRISSNSKDAHLQAPAKVRDLKLSHFRSWKSVQNFI